MAINEEVVHLVVGDSEAFSFPIASAGADMSW